MRLAARIESKAAEANSEAKSAGGKEWEANSEAKSAGGKEWEPEFLFFYRCHTPLLVKQFFFIVLFNPRLAATWLIPSRLDGLKSVL